MTVNLAQNYIELIKDAVLNELYLELEAQLLFAVLCAAHGRVMDLDEFWAVRRDQAFLASLRSAKNSGDTIILEIDQADGRPRAEDGLRNYSEYAYSLVGRKRLDHLHRCVETLLAEDIPGDLLEAGVWRGGSCILMLAVLSAHDCDDRVVWLADSFEGMPHSEAPEDAAYPMGADRLPFLAVSEEEVRQNLRRFNLLNSAARFLPGWFGQTLPDAPLDRLSLLRVDCDLYQSTLDVLDNLYVKVSPGGFVIIDDYGILPPCRRAVDEFRARHGIDAKMHPIDEHAVYWRVESEPAG